ncbi:Wzz/FepE/Etk N-terminal domain-containing protein [Streptomonospora litoralis]|uniref:Chain length determinant protein n=1 Tax=Streptomonospora litoralis TaxID=2498135 RepID=A0A4P6Q569_9ACTN|nr:Wzz/FepE/Etk N-terminal domain-containing protein [Streptomonospora litoralis]QBI55815.1 Chain length determinant protein [Streptomonospora litoralis]
MDTAAGGDLTDVTAALRRRWPIVAAGTAAGLLLAVAALVVLPQTYVSTTAVHVRPSGIPEITGELSGRTNGEVNLDTEAQIVQSAEVAAAAAERLGADAAPVELRRDVEVSVPPNSSVLNIAFPAGSPRDAQRGSAAFARAYLEYRAAQVDRQLGDTLSALESEADSRRAELGELSEGGGAADGGRARITAVQNEITELNKAIHPLRALRASIVPAQIITPAGTPEEAASPMPPLWLAGGGVLGLALGTAAAFAADRRGHRLRSGRDTARAVGLPVLLEVARSAGPADAGSGRPAQRANQAALGLSASLGRPSADSAGAGKSGAVVLVPAVSRGASAGPAATALAAALARIGADVLLVHADPAQAAPDGACGAGLGDALLGGADPAQLERRDAAAPGLRILDYGGADAADVLQRPAMAQLIRRLRSSADIVVVATAPTAERADACALARGADAVVPVVELGRTRTSALHEALAAFADLGVPAPGTVATAPGRAERRRAQRRQAAEHAPLTAEQPTEDPAESEKTGPTADEPEEATAHSAAATSDSVDQGDASAESADAEPQPQDDTDLTLQR